MKNVQLFLLILGISIAVKAHEEGHDESHKEGPVETATARRYYYCGGPGGVVEGQCREDKGCREMYGPSFGGFCVKAPGKPFAVEDGMARNVVLRRLSEISRLLDDIEGPLMKGGVLKLQPLRCAAQRARYEARTLGNMLKWLSRTMENPALTEEKTIELYGVDKATVDEAQAKIMNAYKKLQLVNIKKDVETNVGKVTDFRAVIEEAATIFSLWKFV